MSGRMTFWGVGPKLVGTGIIYSILVALIHRFYLSNLVLPISNLIALLAGISLIITGLLIWLVPAMTIKRSFDQGKLLTTGIYGYIRHPLYSGIILFITTGVVVITKSVIGLSIPILLAILFYIWIKEEDDYLEERFGEEFIEYKKRVGALLPKIK